MAACEFFFINLKVHRSIILPFVLCGCESWFVTVREVLELRKTFGHKRDEVAGEWR